MTPLQVQISRCTSLRCAGDHNEINSLVINDLAILNPVGDCWRALTLDACDGELRRWSDGDYEDIH